MIFISFILSFFFLVKKMGAHHTSSIACQYRLLSLRAIAENSKNLYRIIGEYRLPQRNSTEHIMFEKISFADDQEAQQWVKKMSTSNHYCLQCGTMKNCYEKK